MDVSQCLSVSASQFTAPLPTPRISLRKRKPRLVLFVETKEIPFLEARDIPAVCGMACGVFAPREKRIGRLTPRFATLIITP
jgi:hypothetical protein